MRPGEEASGSVTITNTGTVTGALTLAPTAPADTPGAGGGTLSSRLELLVIDVSTVAVPVTVYAGTIGQMAATDVGRAAARPVPDVPVRGHAEAGRRAPTTRSRARR